MYISLLLRVSCKSFDDFSFYMPVTPAGGCAVC